MRICLFFVQSWRSTVARGLYELRFLGLLPAEAYVQPLDKRKRGRSAGPIVPSMAQGGGGGGREDGEDIIAGTQQTTLRLSYYMFGKRSYNVTPAHFTRYTLGDIKYLPSTEHEGLWATVLARKKTIDRNI
jgi:hypothetical protein